MRPRVFPAEDLTLMESAVVPVVASMRPRVFPAEDQIGRERNERLVPASMRPRVFPAEDISIGGLSSGSVHGFNEAAGIPRGRPSNLLRSRVVVDASMRPRVFPAEDISLTWHQGQGAITLQ